MEFPYLKAHLLNRAGVERRSQLRALGFTDGSIRRWLAAGLIIAPRRSVVALPGIPASLLFAARVGGRVACTSAAGLRGLWVIDDGCLHLAIPENHAGVARDGLPRLRVHWTRRRVDPRSDLVALESGLDMLMHIAACQPSDLAVATFDSAMNKGLVSPAELAELASGYGGRFANVVALASPLAESGLESLTRVRLLRDGIRCREQVVIDGHPVDLLIGDRLIIQLDGKQHLEDPVQLARDRAQDRRLRRMGYTVLRFGYADVVYRWEAVREEILRYVAIGKDSAR
jgi:very-short-patch-repair endonuclease